MLRTALPSGTRPSAPSRTPRIPALSAMPLTYLACLPPHAMVTVGPSQPSPLRCSRVDSSSRPLRFVFSIPPSPLRLRPCLPHPASHHDQFLSQALRPHCTCTHSHAPLLKVTRAARHSLVVDRSSPRCCHCYHHSLHPYLTGPKLLFRSPRAALSCPNVCSQRLAKLIAFSTVSRNANAQLAGYTKERLRFAGVEATLVHSPVKTQGGIALSGHRDAVPADFSSFSPHTHTAPTPATKRFSQVRRFRRCPRHPRRCVLGVSPLAGEERIA